MDRESTFAKQTGSIRIAQVATLPEREPMLRKMIDSIYSQVDRLQVAWNGPDPIPKWFDEYDRLFYVQLDNSTGDAAKFYGVENLPDCYFFGLDDDLIYPGDYANYMVEKVEQYKKGAIVSAHGRTLFRRPIRSYYKDRERAFHCLLKVPADTRVHTAGTGVMCFHTSTIHLRYSDFTLPNMADIWIAKFASEQGIPLVVVAHREGWIVPLDPGMIYKTIWQLHYNDDRLQTELYNSF